jgi:RIO kinase 1
MQPLLGERLFFSRFQPNEAADRLPHLRGIWKKEENPELSIDSLEPFFDEGWITEVIRPVKSGKEATVYLCRAGARAGEELVAAKVYRSLNQRGFKNAAVYWEGGMRAMSRRTKAAIARRSDHGRDVLFYAWIGREKETLEALHRAGANVPRPITQLSSAFLMTWIGDEEEAAPQLRQVRFDAPEKAGRILDFLVSQVELWLAHDVVHGDLSEYNVLFWRGRPIVIDFPQAMDPRFNRNAYSLLQRDLANLVHHFERFGVRRDARALAANMWERWLHSDAWLGVGVGAAEASVE